MIRFAPPYILSSFDIRRSLCLVSLLVLFLAPSVDAALYSCIDATGNTVITDSPAQLRTCTLLSAGRSATPERPSPMGEPPVPRATEPEVPRDHQTPASGFSVPLERLGSLLVVTIQVNGTRPAKVILDTGASHTMLSYAVARDLALWANASATSLTMHTAGGTVRADVLPIASISLGGAEVRHTVATIYDLPEAPPGIEGLLGLDVLRQFEVTLDTVRNRLQLRVHP